MKWLGCTYIDATLSVVNFSNGHFFHFSEGFFFGFQIKPHVEVHLGREMGHFEPKSYKSQVRTLPKKSTV
jgi:hypothetical protein